MKHFITAALFALTAQAAFATRTCSIALFRGCGTVLAATEARYEEAVRQRPFNRFTFINQLAAPIQQCGNEAYNISLNQTLPAALMARGRREVLQVAQMRIDAANRSSALAQRSAKACLREMYPDIGSDIQ